MHLTSRAALVLLLAPLAGCANVYAARPNPRLELVGEGLLAKDGRLYPLGWTGGGLSDAVQGNPRAEAEASSFESERTAGKVFEFLGFGAGLASIALFSYAESTPNMTLQQAQTLNEVDVAVFIGGVLASYVGGKFNSDANQHMFNAINLYNDGIGGGGPPGRFPNYPPPPPPGGGWPGGSLVKPESAAPLAVLPPGPRPLAPWANPQALR
jgi:hypothetical protein